MQWLEELPTDFQIIIISITVNSPYSVPDSYHLTYSSEPNSFGLISLVS